MMFLKISESIINASRPLKVRVPAKAENQPQWQFWAPFAPEAGQLLNLCVKSKGQLDAETIYWVVIEPRLGNRGGMVGTSDMAGQFAPWGGHWEVNIYPSQKSQGEIKFFSRLEFTLTGEFSGPVSYRWPLNAGCLYTVPETSQQKELRLLVATEFLDKLLAQCEQREEEVANQETGEKKTVPYFLFSALEVRVYDNRTEDGRKQKEGLVIKFFDNRSSEQALLLYDTDERLPEKDRAQLAVCALMSFGKMRQLEVLENQAHYFQNRGGYFLALTDDIHQAVLSADGQKITLAGLRTSQRLGKTRSPAVQYFNPADWIEVLARTGSYNPALLSLTQDRLFAIDQEIERQKAVLGVEYRRWQKKPRTDIRFFRHWLVLEKAKKIVDDFQTRRPWVAEKEEGDENKNRSQVRSSRVGA